MKTTELTDESFSKLIAATGRTALVEFGAEWCPPCKAMNPVLDELSDHYEERAVIAKVNVDNNPESASRFGIRNLPTFLFFKNGELAERIVGAVPGSVLKKKVDALLGDGKL